MPNKPMVPTADTSLTEYTPDSLRRHIGRPLGSLEERRGGGATKRQDTGGGDVAGSATTQLAVRTGNLLYAVALVVSSYKPKLAQTLRRLALRSLESLTNSVCDTHAEREMRRTTDVAPCSSHHTWCIDAGVPELDEPTPPHKADRKEKQGAMKNGWHMCAVALLMACRQEPTSQPSSRGQTRRVAAPTHRSYELVAMDQVLVRSDFIGVVQVERIYPSTTEGGVIQLDLSVVDSWYSRIRTDGSLRIGVAEDTWGMFRNVVSDKKRLVVFLSGGPWVHSPLTHLPVSFFGVQQDSTLNCPSGNLLYGITPSGITCSIASYMITPPLMLREMREAVIRSRQISASRLSALDAALATLNRPIEAVPSREDSIDRRVIQNEVVR